MAFTGTVSLGVNPAPVAPQRICDRGGIPSWHARHATVITRCIKVCPSPPSHDGHDHLAASIRRGAAFSFLAR